jgi:amyloid beta A4 precursor protein-binding family B protein 1-interacting protein
MVVYDELLKTPDMDGIIYLKEKSRKSWKKHFCVLRSSGLYFVPKGKSKVNISLIYYNIFHRLFCMYRKILYVWLNLKM